jgi:hypothetical protein
MLIQLIPGSRGRASTWLESPHLRLSGSILSECLPRNVIATLTPQGWMRQAQSYQAIRLRGSTRLMFGLPRDPLRVSKQIQSIALEGSSLWGDGVQLAYYDSPSDMWHTLGHRVWWHSVHLMPAEAFQDDASWPLEWADGQNETASADPDLTPQPVSR